MTEGELRDLMARRESEHIERTRAFDKADKMGQAICAFANDLSGSGETGYLLLGVEDDGRISGRRLDENRFASLGGLKTDGNLLPPPAMSVEKFNLPEGDVVAISVFPSQYPPIRFHGQVWVRIGPRKSIATEEDIRILTERRIVAGLRDEERPCPSAKLDDLDMNLFKGIYLPQAIDAMVIEEDDRPAIEQMAALRFYSLEKDCPTNAGVLLFARHPERYIPSAYIQYVKFAGNDNAGDILQESVFRGPLVKVVQELDTFVKTGPGAMRPVPVSALREAQVAEYPSWALRELILNAIIHRDYFFGNAPIKFYEYDAGRIEISNPGGLFGRVNPQNFPRASDYRNPLIAEALKMLGFVNKFNRGIAKVCADLEANGNLPPDFDINKLTEFRVTVVASKSGLIKRPSGQIKSESGPIKPSSGLIKSSSGQIKSSSGQINPDDLPLKKGRKYTPLEHDEAVLEVVRANPGIKREPIYLRVQSSIKSVYRSLKRLEMAKKVEFRGSNKTGGWYVCT